ncbi:MAG: tRNA 4-thiouridine(8) synthase ThiI [Candidatus Omnitrophica bacterium]|nr:tRNA 4-thiouridine(8) synthase ThiI [Candidatus Omnitrophota bacterium]MDD5429334.1 tRNA 4-thiouridine(8) synthase ThiI [Candidatus Omnitrophota bacterium]
MKAIVLVSGGLDSYLVVRLLQAQGIEPVAVHFRTPFYKQDKIKMMEDALKNMSRSLGVKLILENLNEKYFQAMQNPRYGYGKNFNPCIDCKIFMFRRAKELMDEQRAGFVVSGEVLGQRPMSQNRESMKLIEKESGLEGILVRLLSAKLFEATIAEQKGWLKPEALLGISGRSRKIQIALAQRLGIRQYPWPAGGCLLTEASFCHRLKDKKSYCRNFLEDFELLTVGRHFRLSPEFKFIVGRNEKENSQLEVFTKKGDVWIEPADIPGPSGLGRGLCGVKEKIISAAIIARYTCSGQEVEVLYKKIPETAAQRFKAKALDEEQLRALRV